MLMASSLAMKSNRLVPVLIHAADRVSVDLPADRLGLVQKECWLRNTIKMATED